jgi:hypothetical protein
VKGDGIDPKGGPGFLVRILHHYADACLTGMMFDDAIRLFYLDFVCRARQTEKDMDNGEVC